MKFLDFLDTYGPFIFACIMATAFSLVAFVGVIVAVSETLLYLIESWS